MKPDEVQTSSAASQPQLQVSRTEGGFRATLADAGLWDLVQMNCEARTRSAVRIATSGQYGYLFFDNGQIVHAAASGLTGERAALEILGWRHGQWESTQQPWPERQTITTPWQGLLLRAAQRIDEAARPPSSTRMQRLIAVGAPSADDSAARRISEPPQRASGDHGVSYRSNDFEHAVRIDPNGVITAGQGQTQEFAALASYVCRVGDLIGELLGMGKLAGLDGSLAQGTECLIFRKATGDTVALRPRPGVDLTQLKQQLQL